MEVSRLHLHASLRLRICVSVHFAVVLTAGHWSSGSAVPRLRDVSNLLKWCPVPSNLPTQLLGRCLACNHHVSNRAYVHLQSKYVDQLFFFTIMLTIVGRDLYSW